MKFGKVAAFLPLIGAAFELGAKLITKKTDEIGREKFINEIVDKVVERLQKQD